MTATATQEARSAFDAFVEMKDPATEASAMPALVEPHTLAVLSRSEIDAQLAIADHRPRSIKQFRQTVSDLALISGETAADCIYVLPGRRQRDGKVGPDIEGPSIRWAEIMQYAFNHARVGARLIEEAHDHITAQGIFADLQNNVVTTSEVQRRIVDSRGRRYSADMIAVTANAACSIAKRNAILSGIPRPLWWDIFQRVRTLVASGGSVDDDMAARIDGAVAAFVKMGVSEQRILAKLGVDRAGIGMEELVKLRGFYTAIRDGETTVDEVFPKPAEAQPGPLDQFTASGADRSPSSSTVDTGPNGGGADPKPATDAAEADERSMVSGSLPIDAAPASAVPLQTYRQCIDGVLKAATDKHLPDPQERVAALDGPVRDIWSELMPDADFLKRVLSIAVDCAEGKMSSATARKMMEARVP